MGGAQSHIALSLGLTTPVERITFAITFGLSLLITLPVVTRVCVAVQAGLGKALLSDISPLQRGIRGLEPERDIVRTQAADTDALRQLERDIHDGPQQRLVRLAMELGRAQHHFVYVEAHLLDGTVQPLIRLRYGGSARHWGFGLYLASSDRYENQILPSGFPSGSPEEALDCACRLYLDNPV